MKKNPKTFQTAKLLLLFELGNKFCEIIIRKNEDFDFELRKQTSEE